MKLIVIKLYDNKGQVHQKEFSRDSTFDADVKVWLYDLFVEKELIKKPMIDCLNVALKVCHYTDAIYFGNDKTDRKMNVCFTIEMRNK